MYEHAILSDNVCTLCVCVCVCLSVVVCMRVRVCACWGKKQNKEWQNAYQASKIPEYKKGHLQPERRAMSELTAVSRSGCSNTTDV